MLYIIHYHTKNEFSIIFNICVNVTLIYQGLMIDDK